MRHLADVIGGQRHVGQRALQAVGVGSGRGPEAAVHHGRAADAARCGRQRGREVAGVRECEGWVRLAQGRALAPEAGAGRHVHRAGKAGRAGGLAWGEGHVEALSVVEQAVEGLAGGAHLHRVLAAPQGRWQG